MRIAYLILAHNKPFQLARLVDALPVQSPVFIHIDGRVPADEYGKFVAALADRHNVAFVKRHKCRWGNIGIVHGTLSLMRAALAEPFDRATLLSGSDYPIKSNAEIESDLSEARNREFIEAFRMDQPNRWTPMGGAFGAPGKQLHLHLRFRSRRITIPWTRRMPDGLLPFGGSQWWTLTRSAVEHVVRYSDMFPRFLRFSAYSFIPDESYIQTVVGNSPYGPNVAGRDLRFAIWDRPQPPYPATLEEGDFADMVESGCHFGRKFDASANSHILDLLDVHRITAEQARERHP